MSTTEKIEKVQEEHLDEKSSSEKDNKPKAISIEEARAKIDKQISEKQKDYMKNKVLYSQGKIWKSYKDFIYVGSRNRKILDLTKVDNRVMDIAKLLKAYKDKKIVLFSKNPRNIFVQQLSEIIKSDIKSSYRAGNITNPLTKDFLDVDLIFMFDFYSKDLIKDATKLGIPVVALVEPSKESPEGITLYLPCNKYFKPARVFIAKQIAKYYLEA